MTSLTFVGVTDDGATLTLRDANGTMFEVPVTAKLREALMKPPPRSTTAVAAPPQVVVEGPVTPADVQRLIRQGADIDAIASESGMDPATIQSFAIPVLQERAFIAEQAGKCAVPTGETLAEAVASRLATRGITEGITWDSWRGTSGMWTVVVRFPDEPGTFPLAAESGTWLYDPKTRSVTAEDETARWLTSLPTTPEPEPERVIVIEDVDTREQPAEPRRRRRGRRLNPVPSDEHVAGQLTLSDTTDEEAIAPVPVPDVDPGERTPESPVAPPQPVTSSAKPLSRRAARRQAAKRRTEKHEPTWDEILFGVSRSEDPTRP